MPPVSLAWFTSPSDETVLLELAVFKPFLFGKDIVELVALSMSYQPNFLRVGLLMSCLT